MQKQGKPATKKKTHISGKESSRRIRNKKPISMHRLLLVRGRVSNFKRARRRRVRLTSLLPRCRSSSAGYISRSSRERERGLHFPYYIIYSSTSLSSPFSTQGLSRNKETDRAIFLRILKDDVIRKLILFFNAKNKTIFEFGK